MRTYFGLMIAISFVACGGTEAMNEISDDGTLLDAGSYQVEKIPDRSIPTADSGIVQQDASTIQVIQDAGTVIKKDSSQVVIKHDAGVTKPDAYIPPQPDLGTHPIHDAGIPPQPDMGVPPVKDAGLPPDVGSPVPDAGTPPSDASVPQQIIDNIKWITVRAGTYMMGIPLYYANPAPACYGGKGQVLTSVRKFKMMQFEATREQLSAMGHTSKWTACNNVYPTADGTVKRCPAELDWDVAIDACNALNDREHLSHCCDGSTCNYREHPGFADDFTRCGYRLPTAAEFEYAYRAGTTTEFYNGPASATQCQGYTLAYEIGWYAFNSGLDNLYQSGQGHEHPVGGKQPNAWGFYDLAGNVDEWTLDSCDSLPGTNNGRISMGGSFMSGSTDLQAGVRHCDHLYNQNVSTTGFRCVRSLP